MTKAEEAHEAGLLEGYALCQENLRTAFREADLPIPADDQVLWDTLKAALRSYKHHRQPQSSAS